MGPDSEEQGELTEVSWAWPMVVCELEVPDHESVCTECYVRGLGCNEHFQGGAISSCLSGGDNQAHVSGVHSDALPSDMSDSVPFPDCFRQEITKSLSAKPGQGQDCQETDMHQVVPVTHATEGYQEVGE